MKKLANISQFESLANSCVVKNSERFPKRLAPGDLIKSSQIKGVTQPRLVRDGSSTYVFKDKGKSTRGVNSSLWMNGFDPTRNEIIADNFYRAMGVPVPASRLYTKGAVQGRLSRFVDGSKKLSRFLKEATPEQKRKIIEELAKHAHVDIVIGNDDMKGDNIVVDENGIPYRVDNGYTFFVSQKNTYFPYLLNLWMEMRHPSYRWHWTGRQGKNRLANMLRKIRDTDWTPGLKAIPREYQDYVMKRINQATQAANLVDQLYEQGYDKASINRRLDNMLGPDKKRREQIAAIRRAWEEQNAKTR